MKYRLLLWAGCVVAQLAPVSLWAAPAEPPLPNPAVVTELSRRSGLPQVDLEQMLSHCDADQQSLNFCAWRDQIAAEQAYRRAVDEKIHELPDCRAAIELRVARQERARDSSCRKSSHENYAGASMESMIRARCATAQTDQMIQEVRRLRGCR